MIRLLALAPSPDIPVRGIPYPSLVTATMRSIVILALITVVHSGSLVRCTAAAHVCFRVRRPRHAAPAEDLIGGDGISVTVVVARARSQAHRGRLIASDKTACSV